MTVLSAYGEPFHAQVELISGSELDRTSLTARLASPETYRRFNLSYGTARAGLLVSIERPPAGQPYIRIASGGYIREPVLPLLIVLEWSEGLYVRHYTALLDLPSLDAPAISRSDAQILDSETRAEPAAPRTAAVSTRRPADVVAPTQRVAAPGAVKAPAAAPAAKQVKPVAEKAAPRDAGGSGAPDEMQARARALQQEVLAGDKALAGVQDRIAQLEKTIRDMKVLADAGRPAAEPMPAPQVSESGAVPGSAPAQGMTETPKAAPAAAPPATRPQAAQARREVVASSPPPEPGLMEMVLADLPLYGGGAAVLMLGAGFWLARRRRESPAASAAATAPDEGAQEAAQRDHASARGATPATDSEQMDPLEEAETFMAYGREVQAAQLLEGAVAENPARADLWLKLLEICAARRDKDAFGRHARAFHDLTAGRGENWLKVAALGFALDPGNALYEAGRGATAAAPELDGLDFEADRPPEPPAPEPEQAQDDTFGQPMVASGAAPEARGEPALDMEIAAPAGSDPTPDFSIEEPDTGAPATDLVLDAEEAPEQSSLDAAIMDFKIELPQTDDAPAAPAEAKPSETDDAGAEEPVPAPQLDLGGINLDLEAGKETDAAPSAEGKDPQWRDVQEKFELVKAYRVLGADVESLIEILQEIVKDGDAQQRAEARKAIDRLSKKEE